MSTLPAVTMQDLKLEQAELLPSRETLCSPRGTQNGNTSFGFLSLSLGPGSYAWRFISVPPGGFSDSGSASCH